MSRGQSCRSWDIEPFERYAGPWTQDEGLQDLRSVGCPALAPWREADSGRRFPVLSHPVLFVGNRFDPVTPLSSARRMADGFGAKNAALLTHEGSGHCSTAQPSVRLPLMRCFLPALTSFPLIFFSQLCTAKIIRQYFLAGVLPEAGTTCLPDDEAIFHAPGTDAPDILSTRSYAQEDVELKEALHTLERELKRVRA